MGSFCAQPFLTLNEPIISKKHSFHFTWVGVNWIKHSHFAPNLPRNVKFEMWVPYSILRDPFRIIQLWTSLSNSRMRKKTGISSFFWKMMQINRGMAWKTVQTWWRWGQWLTKMEWVSGRVISRKVIWYDFRIFLLL